MAVRLHTARKLAGCKRFLHELPEGARLRVVEAEGGDLADIRARSKAVKDEIRQVESMPVLSADLPDRIKAYVALLAVKARPVVQGVDPGQALRVLWPLRPDANRATIDSGFSDREGNALLLAALLHPERLAERVMRAVAASSIDAAERAERLSALQARLDRLALQRGGDDQRGDQRR
jgi:hypothetical protein